MQRFFPSTQLAIALTCLLVQGCVNLKPRENDTRFYVLSTPRVEQQEATTGGEEGVIIGLRRLRLAAYLDTPHIVVRVGANEVQFSETHRWGEDLSPAINRMVAGLVNSKPSVQHVDIVPWVSSSHHDYVVEIEINKFEGATSSRSTAQKMDAHLDARWKIVDPSSNMILKQGTTDVLYKGATSPGYAGLVTGLAQVIEMLTDDIVSAVDAL